MGALVVHSEVELRSLSGKLYDELQTQLGRAQSRLADIAWRLDDGAEGGIRGELKGAGVTLGSLSKNGSFTLLLLAGAKTWEQWKERAELVRVAIQHATSQLGLSAYSPSRLWDEVLAPSGSQVVGLIDKAVAQIPTKADLAAWLPWVVVAIVALVVGYLVFTLAPAVSAVSGAVGA